MHATRTIPLRAPTLWVAAMTVALAALLLCMPIQIIYYANDGLTCLEGAWRMHQGMRIYQDFHAPLGPLYFGLLNLGITIAGLSHRAFVVAAVVYLIPIVAASWFVFQRRFTLWPALALTAIQAFTVVGPYCLGDQDANSLVTEMRRTSFGMQYNRMMWPLAMIVLVACLMKPSKGKRLVDGADGLVVGACLTLMYLGKVNFFAAALPVFAYGLWRNRGLWAGSAIVGALIPAAVTVAAGVSLKAYMGDLHDLAAAQSMFRRAAVVFARGVDNLDLILPLAICAGYLAWVYGKDRAARAMLWCAAIAVVYGIVVVSANYQRTQVPTLILAAFFLVEAVRRGREQHQEPVGAFAANVVAYGALGTFCIVHLGAFAVAYGESLFKHQGPEPASIAAKTFGGTIMRPNTLGKYVFDEAEEQSELLDTHCAHGARVSSLMWYNILPVVRGEPSPAGLLWYHEGRTVTRKTMPPATREFARTDAVLWEKKPDLMDRIVVDTYGDFVRSNFVKVAESKHFSLWIRPRSAFLLRKSDPATSPLPSKL